MREVLRKLDEAIEQLRRVPDSHALLAHLELVRHDLMERIYQQVTGRRAVGQRDPVQARCVDIAAGVAVVRAVPR